MPFQKDREDEVDDQQQTAKQHFRLAGHLTFGAKLLELRLEISHFLPDRGFINRGHQRTAVDVVSIPL
ncbi:MAG: hypothetical protein KZQ96_23795 [Candidatus Thiodiazotropha sp. (ex Lucinoma borealis)]|nr:hypothetical protein [Candidatus Thiodiazotropha sp. (ex Lucinoma borealis)]